jgi:hypothetical protein
LQDFLKAHDAFQFAKVRPVHDGEEGQISQPSQCLFQDMVGMKMRQGLGRKQAA